MNPLLQVGLTAFSALAAALLAVTLRTLDSMDRRLGRIEGALIEKGLLAPSPRR